MTEAILISSIVSIIINHLSSVLFVVSQTVNDKTKRSNLGEVWGAIPPHWWWCWFEKFKYCKCNSCGDAIAAACGRLRDHCAKCKMQPRAIGQLDAGFKPSRVTMKQFKLISSSSSLTGAMSGLSQVGLGGISPLLGDTVSTVGRTINQSSPAPLSSFYSGGCEHFDFLKPGEREQLNVLLARAIHRAATPYSALEHPAWKAFFQALRCSYQLPCRAAIGGCLMRLEYVDTMNDVLNILVCRLCCLFTCACHSGLLDYSVLSTRVVLYHLV